MIDLDQNAQELLGRVIYGQAPPTPDYDRELAARLGLRFPLQTRCLLVRPDAPPIAPTGPGIAELALHPGLRYWLAPPELEPVLPEAAVERVGPALICPEPDHLIRVIQRAIVAMRRLELDALPQRPDAPPLAATQSQLFRLCSSQLRAGDTTAAETLDLWLDVVHLRHYGSLNGMRRTLLELLLSLTHERDEMFGLGNRVELAVRAIYGTFALGALRAVYREHLREIAAIAAAVRDAVPGGSDRSLVGRARRYMAANYRHPVALTHVAAHLGVSPAHLARRFKAETGHSVGQDLLTLRLREARVLLESTDLPLKLVAGHCGFASVSHFQRLFRRELGEAPGAYRQHRRD